MKSYLLYFYDRLRYRRWLVVNEDLLVVYEGNWKNCNEFIAISGDALLLVPKMGVYDDLSRAIY